MVKLVTFAQANLKCRWNEQTMSVLEIGCCGAYCRTCPEMRAQKCRGCKIGYGDGTRDIAKARCKMKVCCIGKGLATCGDCDSYATCDAIQNFHGKSGYKYKKYRQAVAFIREHGYQAFLKIADGWKNQYGRYE